MKRIRLFEWHEQTWLPSFLRRSVTDYLSCLFSEYHMYHPTTDLLAKLIRQTGCHKIMDFCSGSGNTVYDLQQLLAKIHDLHIPVELSDKFPDASHFQKTHPPSEHIYYRPEPIDILEYKEKSNAIRTIFSAFHHFPPQQAQQILHSAVQSGDPIAIFEFTECSVFRFLSDLIIPVSVLQLTPRIPNLAKKNIFFTYVFPIIPFLALWDGLISNLRTYSKTQIQKMLDDPISKTYEWEVGEISAGLRFYRIHYVLGWPKHD